MSLFLPKNSHPLHPLARSLRLDILEMINHAGFGHLGGSLSSVDILISLYNSGVFNFDKDHFILSAGHLCPALYAVLAEKCKFPREELLTYAQFNSRLQGHLNLETPGVEFASGALGQGLSFACGLALGDKDRHTVCLTTDGEHNEGQIWEAIAFANKYHQGNLINIIDCNSYQLGGSTKDMMPLDELAAKYIRFGWTVTTVDAHNFTNLEKALSEAKKSSIIYPVCIIAKTTFAKGVSFMENKFEYHDVKNLPEDIYLAAKNELQKY